MGAETDGVSAFEPDYVLPREDVRADFVSTPNVAYFGSQRVRVTTGESLGDVYDPYFNRTYRHFCSHRHTPNRPEPSGYACGVRKGNAVYLAHNVFTLYHAFGTVAIRDFVVKSMRLLLGEARVAVAGLPSTGRVTLMEQPAASRSVLHLLYANTVLRGGSVRGCAPIEVIEELTPLADLRVTVRPAKPVASVRLVPDGTALAFDKRADGSIGFTVPKLLCHQMIELA